MRKSRRLCKLPLTAHCKKDFTDFSTSEGKTTVAEAAKEGYQAWKKGEAEVKQSPPEKDPK